MLLQQGMHQQQMRRYVRHRLPNRFIINSAVDVGKRRALGIDEVSMDEVAIALKRMKDG